MCGAGMWALPFSVGLAQSATDVKFDPSRTKITEQTSPEAMLRFKYRLFPDTPVEKTEAVCGGKALEVKALPYADLSLNRSALLILVDTSIGSANYPRVQTIKNNQQIITAILDKRPNADIGLYSFANDLKELAPLGGVSGVQAGLGKLKTEGMGTRIFYCVKEAIGKLAASKAERKAILIFSDGKDEDKSYTRGDVQKAAEAAGVLILAVGCPESEQDKPVLGELQRLAVDSLGYYAQIEPKDKKLTPQLTPQLTPDKANEIAGGIVGSLVGGGDVTASLKDVDPASKVVVTLTLKGGKKLEQDFVTAAAPVPAATPTPTPTPSATPTPTPSATPDATATPVVTPTPVPLSAWEENKVWYLVGGGALLGLIIVVAVMMGRKKRAEAETFVSHSIPVFPTGEGEDLGKTVLVSGRELAQLVMQDAAASQLAISKTATRIGRRPDNDIVFSNNSVSGHHAEIHLRGDGAFYITDLGSGNGVCVNGNHIQQSVLRNGDIVELGEVRFAFRIVR